MPGNSCLLYLYLQVGYVKLIQSLCTWLGIVCCRSHPRYIWLFYLGEHENATSRFSLLGWSDTPKKKSFSLPLGGYKPGPQRSGKGVGEMT